MSVRNSSKRDSTEELEVVLLVRGLSVRNSSKRDSTEELEVVPLVRGLSVGNSSKRDSTEKLEVVSQRLVCRKQQQEGQHRGAGSGTVRSVFVRNGRMRHSNHPGALTEQHNFKSSRTEPNSTDFQGVKKGHSKAEDFKLSV